MPCSHHKNISHNVIKMLKNSGFSDPFPHAKFLASDWPGFPPLLLLSWLELWLPVLGYKAGWLISILLPYLGALVTLGRLSLEMGTLLASWVVVMWSLNLNCWCWRDLLGWFSS